MNNDIETELHPQAPRETIGLSDDSSDEYQNSNRSNQTESDTELYTEENDILDATRAGLCHRSLTADRQTKHSRVDCACVNPLRVTGGSTR